MQLDRIILFTARALGFSAGIGVIYAVSRLVWLKAKRKPMNVKAELVGGIFVIYLAALYQITVVRSGIRWDELFSMKRGIETIQLMPIITTLRELEAGLWDFIYPVVGNMLWFLPLGFLLGVLKPRISFGTVTIYSYLVSLSIELLQWFFGSGISDIDDIIFNVAGAVIGLAAFRLMRRWFSGVRVEGTGEI